MCVVLLRSYLGYGLMAARAKVIEAGKDDPNHPCFAKGSSLKYSYAGAAATLTRQAVGGLWQ